MHVGFTYEIECVDRDGNPRWQDKAPNTLTSTAMQLMLGAFLRGDEMPEKSGLQQNSLPFGSSSIPTF